MFETESGLQAVAKSDCGCGALLFAFSWLMKWLNRLCEYWMYPTPYVALLDHRISNPGGPVQDESLRM